MMKSDTQMQVRISQETKDAAQEVASGLGISLSSYIKMLINTDIKAREAQAKRRQAPR